MIHHINSGSIADEYLRAIERRQARRDAVNAEIDTVRPTTGHETWVPAGRVLPVFDHQPDDPGCAVRRPRAVPKILVIIPMLAAVWAALWAVYSATYELLSAQ